jgi:hypothetical protein
VVRLTKSAESVEKSVEMGVTRKMTIGSRSNLDGFVSFLRLGVPFDAKRSVLRGKALETARFYTTAFTKKCKKVKLNKIRSPI